MRVPRGPGPKSGRKPGGKAGPSGPKAPARARSAPKAAAARKATQKPPAKKPEKAHATGKGGVVQAVRHFREIGSASGRGRVCQYVWNSVVVVAVKKKNKHKIATT